MAQRIENICSNCLHGTILDDEYVLCNITFADHEMMDTCDCDEYEGGR